MDDHPGIVFRDGPTGRRAGLPSGPDVWEVIQVVGANGKGEPAIRAAAEWLGLTEAQVRAAVRYYSEFPAEVDECRNLGEAEAAETAWRRKQDAIG